MPALFRGRGESHRTVQLQGHEQMDPPGLPQPMEEYESQSASIYALLRVPV